jgi:hypothetical protein
MEASATQSPREFEKRITDLDVALFDSVLTQSNAKDRRSWLADTQRHP